MNNGIANPVSGAAMAPRDDRLRGWQQRAARYRQFAALLGDDETTSRLRALALEIEQRLAEHAGPRFAATEATYHGSILLTEIDTLLARLQGAMFFANHMLRPFPFSADDLQKASRLCREEAQACEDAATRRALASRALALAMLGDKVAREKPGRQA